MTVRLTGAPRRLYCFTLGYEPVPESLSVLGGDPARFLLEPVTGVAVAYDDGWALLDSGFNVDTIRDAAARATHYNFECYTGVIPPGDPLLDQVAAAGLLWRNLAFAAISHLHCDHSGGIRHLEDGPPVVLQDREYDFGMADAGLEHAYFRDDYDRAGLTYRLLDGASELAPGLRALPTFGHTPGHMSFEVDLVDTGTVVLAGDAADLRRNITGPVPCGSTTHPELEPAAARAVHLLHELDARPGVQVWPSHDPQFWPTRLVPPRHYT